MSLCLTELGVGWGPAVLESQEEHDFVRQAQKGLSDLQAYFIGGSLSFRAGGFGPHPYLYYVSEQVAGNFYPIK